LAAVSPALDGLAANGLKLTQGYADSPVCSPTRFALMTARYQYRLRGAAEEPINSKSRRSTTLGLPPEHPTLHSLLKDSGWRTALIGKWHLGYPPSFGPLRSAPGGVSEQRCMTMDWSSSTSRTMSANAPTAPRMSRSASPPCVRPGSNGNATLPPIPGDATISLGYAAKDMPHR
jgi:arylsulfatase A-like enzyme